MNTTLHKPVYIEFLIYLSQEVEYALTREGLKIIIRF